MELTGYIEECSEFAAEWRDAGKDFVVAHTSGSTGAPKEIRLSKNDMAISARATNRFFGIGSGSLLHLPLSLSYIAGKMMIVRASEADCVLLAEKPSSSPLADYAGRDITLSAVVPSQIPGLLNGKGWRKIDNLIIGGAPLSAATERKLQELGVPAYATYGMTETCSHVALRRMGTDAYTAMPGIRFATDHRNCLRINAPQFSFRQLQTNDIVDLLSPQSFIWKGRYDNVINSGGIKIFPEQLEAKLQPYISHPFFIGGVPHPTWGTAVELIVELPDSKLTDTFELEQQLHDICRTHLTTVECPKSIKFTAALPRTANGKIRRNS